MWKRRASFAREVRMMWAALYEMKSTHDIAIIWMTIAKSVARGDGSGENPAVPEGP
jgi:hypothetical protein